MTAKVTLGAVGTLDLQLEGGAYRISVAITSDAMQPLRRARPVQPPPGVVDAERQLDLQGLADGRQG